MDYRVLANLSALTTKVLLQVPTEITSFMEYLDREIKPKNFLELGVCFGGTFFIWAHLAQPGGVKLGIDLPNGPWGSPHKVDDKTYDQCKHMLQTLAPSCYIHHGDSRKPESIEWVKEKLDGKQLDFVFIDADHTYEGVKQDYYNYLPLVKKGGIIVLHDIKETDRHKEAECTVYKFWQELEGDKKEFCDPAYDWGGIGVIKV